MRPDLALTSPILAIPFVEPARSIRVGACSSSPGSMASRRSSSRPWPAWPTRGTDPIPARRQARSCDRFEAHPNLRPRRAAVSGPRRRVEGVRRRALILLLGGAAAVLTLRAQPAERLWRVGVLMGIAQDDAGAERRVAAFARALQELGWTDGRNLRIDYRWSGGGTDAVRAAARELAGLRPDVLVGHRVLPTLALQQATGRIPIVFTGVGDPIFYGLVESLARPGRNVTGFTNFAPMLGAELLALLNEMAPRVTRAAVMFNPDVDPTSMAYAGAAADAARSLAVETIFTPIYAPPEIEAAMTMLGREPGGGLLVPPNDFTTMHRASIIALAARYRL